MALRLLARAGQIFTSIGILLVVASMTWGYGTENTDRPNAEKTGSTISRSRGSEPACSRTLSIGTRVQIIQFWSTRSTSLTGGKHQRTPQRLSAPRTVTRNYSPPNATSGCEGRFAISCGETRKSRRHKATRLGVVGNSAVYRIKSIKDTNTNSRMGVLLGRTVQPLLAADIKDVNGQYQHAADAVGARARRQRSQY